MSYWRGLGFDPWQCTSLHAGNDLLNGEGGKVDRKACLHDKKRALHTRALQFDTGEGSEEALRGRAPIVATLSGGSDGARPEGCRAS